MSSSAVGVGVSSRIEKVIAELLNLHEIVRSGQVAAQILEDFRDALNRVRNTAWAAQQYVVRQENGQDSANMLSFVTGERVRAAYHMCCLIRDDLNRSEVDFQVGSLIQLHDVIKALSVELEEYINQLG